MERVKLDPCVLIKRRNGGLKGLIMLQVDGSLIPGDGDFMGAGQVAPKELISKDI